MNKDTLHIIYENLQFAICNKTDRENFYKFEINWKWKAPQKSKKIIIYYNINSKMNN